MFSTFAYGENEIKSMDVDQKKKEKEKKEEELMEILQYFFMVSAFWDARNVLRYPRPLGDFIVSWAAS